MSSDSTRRYLVAYDIPDDKRRGRMAKRLLTSGDRIQYSVFVCDVKPARMVRLKAELEELIVEDEDSILFCDLGKVAGIDSRIFSFLGLDRSITPTEAIIL